MHWLTEILRRALTSPEPQRPRPHRRGMSAAVYCCALAVGSWFFLYQYLAFRRLTLTSDIFSVEQLSRTWLNGRFYWENCYGDELATHTYLIAPILAFFTVPLGALGLLLCSAMAIGACLIGIVAIARLFKVPDFAALGWAVLFACSPLVLGFYQDPLYGFHLELLEPAFAVWLAYFLLQRRWLASVLVAGGLLLVKEDTPLVVIALCAAIASEDVIRFAFGRGSGRGKPINWPAVACGVLALAALPMLLWVIHVQPLGPRAVGSFSRLRPISGQPIDGASGLVRYVVGNLWVWLGSPRTGQALTIFSISTFGFIFLRPVCGLFGIATILVSWLMQDRLLWPPRFAGALGFLLVAGTLGFVSAWSLVESAASSLRARRVVWLLAATIGALLAGWGLSKQAALYPDARDVYLLAPKTAYSKQEIAQADRVFAVYRRLSKRQEPVSASPMLFRYAHDRDLLWTDGLTGGIQPTWILRDFERVFPRDEAERLFDPEHVEMLAYDGRFALYHRRAPREGFVSRSPDQQWTGPFRLHVTFPKYSGTVSEPLISTGSPGAADLIYVVYVNPSTIILAHDSMDNGAEHSGRIPIDYAKEHVLDVGLASLGCKLASGRTVEIALDGRVVMMGTTPFHASKPYEVVFGYNACDMGSSVMLFHGAITHPEHLAEISAAPAELQESAAAGPLLITLTFPANKSSGSEPLVATGVWGKGDIVFVHYLENHRVQLGVDHWGIGGKLGPVLNLTPGPHTLVVDSAALEPPLGDAQWGALGVADQRQRINAIEAWLDGRNVLSASYRAHPSRQEDVVVGANSITASSCEAEFTGKIAATGRLEPAADWIPGPAGRVRR